MSKSKGNVVSPGRSSTATAPTPRAATSSSSARPTRTPTGPTRASRASTASSAGSGASAAEPAERQPRRAACPTSSTADDLELVRKAHWAIEKVTDDMSGRFAFNTAIAAVMELTNECLALREARPPSAARCASRWRRRRSLLFPFAPHAAADAYDALTGERVWEEPWPAADPALPRARHLRAGVPGQRQGPRPRARRRAARDGRARGARLRGAERARACRRPRGREGDRRAREARQRRGPLIRHSFSADFSHLRGPV